MSEQRTAGLEPPAAPGTRPAGRREHVLAAAAELFYRDGYPAVGMSDIADAVGVGPSALYRHVGSKQELLLVVVERAIRPGLDASADQADLDTLLARLVDGALEDRRLGVLWQRESRHLDPDDRRRLRDLIRAAMQALRDAVRQQRPELDEPRAELLAWSVFAVLISLSYHQVEMPRDAWARLLRSMTRTVVDADLPPLVLGVGTTTPVRGLGSRREQLLAAGARLFVSPGYEAVGVDDLAAEAGLATASFYHHFKGKPDLLRAMLARGNEAVRTEVVRALAAAEDDADALRRAMRSYVDLVIDAPHLVEAIVHQTPHLLPAERRWAQEAQHDLVQEWVRLLRLARPGLGPHEARVRMQAALTVVNDVAGTAHLRRTSGVRDALDVVTGGLLLG